MPSRFGTCFIVLFWLSTVGYVGYRDVWPRLFRDSAPTIWIDLTDEATQTLPVRWSLYRGNEQISTVSTQLIYDSNTDAFRFVTIYKNFQVEVPPIRCSVPEMEMTTIINRDGQLRGQNMKGSLIAKLLGQEMARGSATVESVVQNGELVGSCYLESDFFPNFTTQLEPTPVPDGQVLNPLQPVNRLRGVRPGLRWVIYSVDPLGEAISNATRQVLTQKGMGASLFAPKTAERESKIATVADAPVDLRIGQHVHSCWTIEVRGDQGTTTIFVRIRDGIVMRQEAVSNGDSLRLDRQE